jgi:hypothetical protein
MSEPAVYPSSAVERAMKVQEVILRAIDGRVKWYQAAEILRISDRQMLRWRRRHEEWGYDGLFDRRRRRPDRDRARGRVQAQAVISALSCTSRLPSYPTNVLRH